MKKVLIASFVWCCSLAGVFALDEADNEPTSHCNGWTNRQAIQHLDASVNVEDRRMAVLTLGEIGAARKSIALPALTQTLFHDEDATVREGAARALARVGCDDENALEKLLTAHRDDPDLGVRQSAAWSLSQMGVPQKTPLAGLIQCLAHDSAEVRRAATDAMQRVGPAASDAVPGLEKLLDDESLTIRAGAAWALWTIAHHQRAVPKLIELVEHSPNDVSNQSVHNLGQIGPEAKAAIPALCQILAELTLEAQDADRGKKPEFTIFPGVSADTLRCCAAAEALGRIGPEARPAVPRLEQLFKNEQAACLQIHVAGALLKINNDPDALAALIAAVKDENTYYRIAAIRQLGESGSSAKAAVPTLKEVYVTVRDHQVQHPTSVGREVGAALRSIDPDAG